MRGRSQAKGSGEENGSQHDELADDDDDDVPSVKIIEIGDVLPAVTLKNEKDEDVNVAELAAEKGLVLFLVPKADTRQSTLQLRGTVFSIHGGSLISDTSAGCTKQACGFRDSHPDFTKHNFSVYCVSADTVSAQAKWQTKVIRLLSVLLGSRRSCPFSDPQQELPYSLLSDRQRVLIKAFGAADGTKTKRSHFIFEKGGKLVDKKVPVKPVDR
jgi:peroxiredoxin Q/BCP